MLTTDGNNHGYDSNAKPLWDHTVKRQPLQRKAGRRQGLKKRRDAGTFIQVVNLQLGKSTPALHLLVIAMYQYQYLQSCRDDHPLTTTTNTVATTTPTTPTPVLAVTGSGPRTRDSTRTSTMPKQRWTSWRLGERKHVAR